jgi:hypothetical protein
VLKKAGIVVAAAAAGLLAVSPLAFAGESHGKGHGHGSDDVNSYYQTSEGLVNVSDINANVPVNALNCNEVDLGLIPVDVDPITAPISGALALFGEAESEQFNAIDNSCNATQGASSVDAVTQSN